MKKIKNNKANKKTYLIMFVGIIIGVIISIASSYAIAETLIKSVDVSYVDNSKLGATNVQTAIDGTCTKFSTELQSFLLKVYPEIYPVGSIYISYSSTNPSSFLGGTWEAFGKGQTLVGIDSSQTEFSTVGKTGGEKVHTLTVDEMPSHTHIQDPHQHKVGFDRDDIKNIGTDHGEVDATTSAYFNSNTIILGPRMWTLRALETTATNQYTGGSKSHNNLQPYITVYMWRRTK